MRHICVRSEIEQLLCDVTKIKIDKPYFKYEWLKTFGIDRSNIKNLILEIEKYFGIRLNLSNKEMEKIKTVERLSLLVNEALYQKAPWE